MQPSPPIDVTKPYDPTSLKGKTVVITGAANGLGARFALRWAAHGANIVFGDLDDAAGEALAARLRSEFGVAAHYQHCDVRDWDQQVALFEAAVQTSPRRRVDVVVPNAGVSLADAGIRFESPVAGPDGSLPKPDLRTLEINLIAAAYTVHLGLHYLCRPANQEQAPARTRTPQDRAPGRCILLLGSIAGVLPFAGQSLYAASKHGICGMFRTLRTTAFRSGVRINMVCPYFVANTPMLPRWSEGVFVSGGAGGAAIADVVDAATRLVADEGMVGRALVVGPRIAGADDDDGESRAGVWECFAEDEDQLELFTRRWVALLRAVEAAKGWTGWVADLWRLGWRR